MRPRRRRPTREGRGRPRRAVSGDRLGRAAVPIGLLPPDQWMPAVTNAAAPERPARRTPRTERRASSLIPTLASREPPSTGATSIQQAQRDVAHDLQALRGQLVHRVLHRVAIVRGRRAVRVEWRP